MWLPRLLARVPPCSSRGLSFCVPIPSPAPQHLTREMDRERNKETGRGLDDRQTYRPTRATGVYMCVYMCVCVYILIAEGEKEGGWVMIMVH
mmetsp:Transcript_48409/g.121186  ORF Transcript_48409/g.121186 Transcript_48409/m.121186 type:complete len:92 (+) Transcript_48409:681-956(+)